MVCRQLFYVMAFLLCPWAAQAQVSLSWKLSPGDRFVVEEELRTKQTLSAKGNEERHEIGQVRRLRFEVLKKNDDGTLILEQKFTKMQITKDGEEQAATLLKKLSGISLRFTLEPPRTITGPQGYAELVKALAGDDKAKGDLVRLLIPEESLLATLETVFFWTPAQAVSPKADWKTESILRLGPLGGIRCENNCTFTEEKKNSAKVMITSKGDYMSPPEKPALKIPRGNLRFEKSAGTVSFDVAKGRLDRAEFRRIIKGTLGFVTATANVDMDMQMEQIQKLRVVDAEK